MDVLWIRWLFANQIRLCRCNWCELSGCTHSTSPCFSWNWSSWWWSEGEPRVSLETLTESLPDSSAKWKLNKLPKPNKINSAIFISTSTLKSKVKLEITSMIGESHCDWTGKCSNMVDVLGRAGKPTNRPHCHLCQTHGIFFQRASENSTTAHFPKAFPNSQDTHPRFMHSMLIGWLNCLMEYLCIDKVLKAIWNWWSNDCAGGMMRKVGYLFFDKFPICNAIQSQNENRSKANRTLN